MVILKYHKKYIDAYFYSSQNCSLIFILEKCLPYMFEIDYELTRKLNQYVMSLHFPP